MRSHHYPELKIVYWLRKLAGIKKPKAATIPEWNKWKIETKKSHPVGWFFTETFPRWAEIIPKHTTDKIDDLWCYISNIQANTHGLSSRLKKGKWHEYHERLLHSCFDSFVDFIEEDEAFRHIAWHDDESLSKYDVPWHQNFEWGRIFFAWRCPRAGIDHMNWEMTLVNEDPPSLKQSINANERMILYVWWTKLRPARTDPCIVSGISAFHQRVRDSGRVDFMPDLTQAEEAERSALYGKLEEIKAAYAAEDEEMLFRLIKLRESVWT